MFLFEKEHKDVLIKLINLRLLFHFLVHSEAAHPRTMTPIHLFLHKANQHKQVPYKVTRTGLRNYFNFQLGQNKSSKAYV